MGKKGVELSSPLAFVKKEMTACLLDRNRAGDLSVYDFAITAERDSQLHHKGILAASEIGADD